MKQPLTLKLVLRSWKQSRMFAVISILSLAVGIACTNLLIMFVIHEYNIEKSNPACERILFITQDHPMKEGQTVPYASENIPPLIKEKFPEVEDYLRINTVSHVNCKVDEQMFPPLLFLHTDPSFTKFFSYPTTLGSLDDIVGKPDVIAITEHTAQRLFGKENPIGKNIVLNKVETDLVVAPSMREIGNTEKSFRVGAVLKYRDQSFLHFDALLLAPLSSDFYGGAALFLMNRPTDPVSFAAKVNDAKVPTLLPDQGEYHFQTLQDAYFTPSLEAGSCIQHREKGLLKIGLASAIFILVIACFNYVNLNFSRMLRQVKTIHTQKLMGATNRHIRRQLFVDTFLTILLAFLLSVLLIHDFLPVFNSIVSSAMRDSFLYNRQVLPVIVLFVILLSVVPAVYISSRLPRLSGNDYKRFYTGRRKQQIVSLLVIIQFILSVSLIMASIVVNNQIGLVKQGGERYRNVIEMGSDFSAPALSLQDELKKLPGIESTTVSGFSVLNAILRESPVRKEDGSEIPGMVWLMYEGPKFLQTLSIRQLQGESWEKLCRDYKNAVLVNEKFVEKYVPAGDDPIGKPLKNYDLYADSAHVIGGVIENILVNSLEEEIAPMIILPLPSNTVRYLHVRLDGKNNAALLEKIRQVWQKNNPNLFFSYRDMYREFLLRSKNVTELAELLMMYSLISIFLTCFGLFGMALYATEQRTKEIGIRKINGATTKNILILLNKQFIGWIIIAFLIACPLTWYGLNRWLEHFVYRTEVTITICLWAILLVVGITLLTVSWHSYKAASANPVKSIKTE